MFKGSVPARELMEVAGGRAVLNGISLPRLHSSVLYSPVLGVSSPLAF